MNDVYRLIAMALIIAVLCFYLKNAESQLFIPALVAGGAVLLFYAGAYLSYALGVFTELTQKAEVNSQLLSAVIKITAVCYLIEFACSLIEDFGIKSISDKLLFVGKIIVLCLSAPIFESLFETVISFLELL